jgi:hypothetical protein
LENKIRELLPSQGGAGAGFDLSASTQIIPIVDLTESAEGSNLREDLQKSFSFNDITAFSVSNATNTVLINNTGYFRVFGNCFANNNGSGSFNLFDGASSKTLITYSAISGVDDHESSNFDFMVFLGAGDSFRCTSSSTNATIRGATKQIASIDGTLTNPS